MMLAIQSASLVLLFLSSSLTAAIPHKLELLDARKNDPIQARALKPADETRKPGTIWTAMVDVYDEDGGELQKRKMDMVVVASANRYSQMIVGEVVKSPTNSVNGRNFQLPDFHGYPRYLTYARVKTIKGMPVTWGDPISAGLAEALRIDLLLQAGYIENEDPYPVASVWGTHGTLVMGLDGKPMSRAGDVTVGVLTKRHSGDAHIKVVVLLRDNKGVDGSELCLPQLEKTVRRHGKEVKVRQPPGSIKFGTMQPPNLGTELEGRLDKAKIKDMLALGFPDFTAETTPEATPEATEANEPPS